MLRPVEMEGKIKTLPPEKREIAEMLYEELRIIGRPRTSGLIVSIILSMVLSFILVTPVLVDCLRDAAAARQFLEGPHAVPVVIGVAVIWILFVNFQVLHHLSAMKAACTLQQILRADASSIAVLLSLLAWDPSLEQVLRSSIVKKFAPAAFRI